jgi:hypothetical protein
LLVKAADERLGLTAALADCLEDARQADRVDHTLHDLLRQRIYGLALGYEDANDAARIGDDPMHKLLLDRDPLSGASLASQPTLSRFENGVDRRGLFALSDRLADVVLDRLKARRRSQPPRLVTIDLDPTCDPTHGRQQLTFFHGHYDTYCYLPVLGFVTLDDEPESFLVAAVLRSGRAPDKQGAIGILRRLIAKVRQRFPRTRIRVRLDGGFMSWEVLAFLDQAGVEYVVGYANNKRLAQDCADLAEWAQQRYEACGHPVQVFGELEYSAKPWKGKTRRLIVKAEVVESFGREPKVNLRFVVTNLRRHRPANLYALYCQRGDIENPGPDELHRLLGQPAARPPGGGRLRDPAGAAHAASGHRSCPGTGRPAAALSAAYRGAHRALRASDRRAPGRCTSLAATMDQSGGGARCHPPLTTRTIPRRLGETGLPASRDSMPQGGSSSRKVSEIEPRRVARRLPTTKTAGECVRDAEPLPRSLTLVNRPG